ncbi:hypothetical protein ACOT81_39225 [Streptomyces sp. WI04-05B]|uniref:Uncharacterized protein n=1 Tax=Streptomyces turgidiscabies (strain Car8) TaxID=698760 RepID=L7F3K5_STRT8|nr:MULTISPECIES: hypothetical protein [Streptomyces]ELP66163.1 hypothetical protein STRTUCAR8_01696 [Streptomyces turgidiscabies Car8]MDX2549015.1 hypothetical protein [Streptomyces sp. WI04-05B]MDX2590360.1 hypothetical protein [Streptomyces sp. WI04-05A]MDX3500244.1 hypothetical protein [Streptomyces turgidiscabies]
MGRKLPVLAIGMDCDSYVDPDHMPHRAEDRSCHSHRRLMAARTVMTRTALIDPDSTPRQHLQGRP